MDSSQKKGFHLGEKHGADHRRRFGKGFSLKYKGLELKKDMVCFPKGLVVPVVGLERGMRPDIVP